MDSLRLLLITVVALGVIVGLVSRSKGVKIITRILFVPIISLFVWSLLDTIWAQLTAWEQLVIIMGGILAIILYLLFATTFGREVLASVIGDFIYDRLKSKKHQRR